MTATYNYITDTGVIVQDTTDLLSDVNAEWSSVLGQNMNPAAYTIQGTLISGETVARAGVMKNNADLANTINPDYSYGVYLDALASLTGVGRGVNQSTVVQGVIVQGDIDTPLAAGSRVQTSNKDIFSIQTAVTIPASGQTTVTLVSQASGPVPIPQGALTIIDGTTGWNTCIVDGTATITLGTVALTDGQLKFIRKQRLANQGSNSAMAIQAAVMGVANVTSCKVIENNTGAAGVVNGVTFTLPSAMWVCIAGTPNQNDVAQALLNAHGGGCPWDVGTNNDIPHTPVTANDPSNKVQYNTQWVTPVIYECYAYVFYQQGTSSAAPTPSIGNAIVKWATGGEDNEPGLVVGADLSPFDISGAVHTELPGMQVKNVLVARVPQGSPPPVYPNGFSASTLKAKPFEQHELLFGNIIVQAAT